MDRAPASEAGNPGSTPGEGTSRRGMRKRRIRRSEPASEDRSRLREGEAPNQRSGAANPGDAVFPWVQYLEARFGF